MRATFTSLLFPGSLTDKNFTVLSFVCVVGGKKGICKMLAHFKEKDKVGLEMILG